MYRYKTTLSCVSPASHIWPGSVESAAIYWGVAKGFW